MDRQTYVRQTLGVRMSAHYDMVNVYVVRPGRCRCARAAFSSAARSTQTLGGVLSHVPRRNRRRSENGFRCGVLRELREETGLQPIEFYQLDTIDLFYLASGDSSWHAGALRVIVRRELQIVLNDEHDDHRRVPRARIDADFPLARRTESGRRAVNARSSTTARLNSTCGSGQSAQPPPTTNATAKPS